MIDIYCPRCQERQWSIRDKKYLELFNHCWSCDKKSWERGWLPLDEFERREKESLLNA